MPLLSLVRSFVKQHPVLHSIAVRSRDTLRRAWYQRFRLRYVPRKILAGPNAGLIFYAARRFKYSRDFWSGQYELRLCQLLEQTVTPDAVCYDIGANLGYHALIMARRASAGHVFAFEPLPEAVDILRRNMIANAETNVILVTKAVAASGGVIQMGCDITVDQAAIRWSADGDSLHRPFRCECVSVDEFVAAGNPPPTFIKIDVEGAESEVLDGAIDCLKRFRPAIICETHGAEQTKRVYEILKENGYSLSKVAATLSPIESVEAMPTNWLEGHVFARPPGFVSKAVW